MREHKIGRALRSRRGMTLVEVIVAMLIIALAALAMLGAFGTALKIYRRGTQQSRDADAAYTNVEDIAAQPEGQGAAGSVTFSVTHSPGGGGAVTTRVYRVDGRYIQNEADGGETGQSFTVFESLSGEEVS